MKFDQIIRRNFMSNRTGWNWPIHFQWPSCETGVNNDEQYAKKQNRCKQMGKKLEDVNRWQRHQATRGGADGVLNRNDGGFCWNIKKKKRPSALRKWMGLFGVCNKRVNGDTAHLLHPPAWWRWLLLPRVCVCSDNSIGLFVTFLLKEPARPRP